MITFFCKLRGSCTTNSTHCHLKPLQTGLSSIVQFFLQDSDISLLAVSVFNEMSDPPRFHLMTAVRKIFVLACISDSWQGQHLLQLLICKIIKIETCNLILLETCDDMCNGRTAFFRLTHVNTSCYTNITVLFSIEW